MIAASNRLPMALQDAGILPLMNLADWDLVIRQGRRAGLLARLAIQLAERDLLARVPAAPRSHLAAERILAEKHARDVRWEVRCIRQALAPIGVDLILLKGAAYILADLPPARGRLFNDVDILVPKSALADVERALLRAGWTGGAIDPYDDRYYRRWMHQIPPLTTACGAPRSTCITPCFRRRRGSTSRPLHCSPPRARLPGRTASGRSVPPT
jgi:hypothetical protein